MLPVWAYGLVATKAIYTPIETWKPEAGGSGSPLRPRRSTRQLKLTFWPGPTEMSVATKAIYTPIETVCLVSDAGLWSCDQGDLHAN